MNKVFHTLTYLGLLVLFNSCGWFKYHGVLTTATITSPGIPVGPPVAPITSNLIPTSLDEDVQGIFTLVYSDGNGDLASTCSVSNLLNVTITQACTCTFGLCTVGVTGTAEFSGMAGFDFNVTANGDVSNTSSAAITIDPVDDAPIVSVIANQTTNKNISTGAINFTITDVDSVLTCAGSVTATSSRQTLIPNSSIVIGGSAPNCTVTLTPENEKGGPATITLNVTDGTTIVPRSFVFWVNGSGWEQEAYIKAANADAFDNFGSSVSVSGDTLVVGADYESSNLSTITSGVTASSDNSSSWSGAVYVYKRSGGNWTQEAYIKSSNSDAYDYFGYTISLSGNTLAVGSTSEASNQNIITNGSTSSSDNSKSGSGAVYVYKRAGTTWTQEAYIKAVNSDTGDNFGYSLSLNGETLAVGAVKEASSSNTITNAVGASSDNSSTGSGATYVYRRSGATWTHEAYIKAYNSEANDSFGNGVSISGDSLAVGAPLEASNQSTITNGETASSNNSFTYAGAVYVYKRTGTIWAQQAYIKAVNVGSFDSFGENVSLSGDSLAVGARTESSNQNSITNGATASSDDSSFMTGAVYVYKRTGSAWAQEAYIKASNGDTLDGFGGKLSLSSNTLAVRSVNESSNQTTITNGTSASGDNSAASSGAVYVFRRTGSTWAQEAYIKAVNGEAYDQFGHSLSLSADTLAVGAPNEDSNLTTITNGTSASADNSSTNSGAVYVYRNYGRLFDAPEFTSPQSSSTSISLSWSTAGSRAVGYKIAYQAGTTSPADCSSGIVIDVGNVYNYTITSLVSTSNYSFRICSYDIDNNVSEGYTNTFQTLSLSPEVTSLMATPDLYDITLSWLSGGGTTVGFKVAYVQGTTAPSDCASGTVVDVGNVSTYQVGGLTLNTTYSFRVCSYPASLISSFGEKITAATYDLGWIPEAYIKAANSGVIDEFGWMTSLSGDTLAVSARRESSNQTTITNGTGASSDNSRAESGAVYVYKRSGSIWSQEAYVKAVNADANDGFGASISLSGNTLAVSSGGESSNQNTITNGASASSNNSTVGAGATYVYTRSGSTWTQEAYIKAANNQRHGYGSAVSLSGDTLVVSANGEASNQNYITNGPTASTDASLNGAGAVYVYKRKNSLWTQQAYIKAANADSGDIFGSAISLSGDTLAVGAFYESSNETTITNGSTASSDNSNFQSGAVYVYKRTISTWAQEAYIKATNADTGDLFGSATSLSGDTLAVGTPYERSNQATITNGTSASPDNSNFGAGAVYVYKRSGSNWAQEAFIKAANSNTNDQFGSTVALSGSTLVVGAQWEGSNQTGITNGPTASADNSLAASGAVYVYVRNGSNWAQEAYIKSSNSDAYDLFGSSVSLSGDTIAVGVYNEDSSQNTITNGPSASFNNGSTSNGATYIYRNNLRLFDPPEFISTNNSADSLTFTWNKAGAKAIGYKLAYQLGTTAPASCSAGTVIDVGNVLTYTVSPLTSTSSYSFRICSYDSLNTLSEGYTTTFRTGTLSPDVLSLAADPGPDSISLSWLTGGGATTGFKIAYASGTTAPADCTLGTVVDVGNVASYTITGLTPLTNYSFRLCSYDATLTLSYGETINSTTVDLGWVQESYIKASNANTSDKFGQTVSLSGDTLAVAAISEASSQITITNGTSSSSDNSLADSGATYIYKRTGKNWVQEAYIKAANANANDQFGYSLSLNGDTLAVGSIYESSNETSITNGATASADNSSPNSGATYIYKRSGSTWAQEAYIKAANADATDYFGYSISISGNTLAVGAVYEDNGARYITNGPTALAGNTSNNSGATYVYRRTGSTWVQEAFIKASNADAGDYFGSSVSLSGEILAVGAIGESSNQTTISSGVTASPDNSSYWSGATYIFRRSGSSWAQEAYVKASNNDASDQFGGVVSLSSNTLAVGAFFEASNQTIITNGTSASSDNSLYYSGAVYVYKRTGTTWAQEAYIKAANADSSDNFANSISLSGNTLVVGAPHEASNQMTITNGATASANNLSWQNGAVYVYHRTGTIWAQEAYIKAVNSGFADKFGTSVSLSGDTIAVGAINEASSQSSITNGPTASSDNSFSSSGATYIYRNNARLFDPPELIYTNLTSSSISFSWNKAGLKAVGYKIAYQLGSTAPADCNSGTVVDVGNVLTYTLPGLSSSSDYSFRVCSYDSVGNLSQGYTLGMQTALAAPEILSLTSVSNFTSITLNWTTGGGATTGFKVAYDAGATAPANCTLGTVVDVATATTYALTGLGYDQTYSFRVCSYNSLGQLSLGTVVTDTSLAPGWAQEAFIKASNSANNHFFGFSVSLSGDTLAVGAYGEGSDQSTITNSSAAIPTNNDTPNSGAVYIYKRSGSTWVQESFIKAINNYSDSYFGYSVSLSGDSLAVGSYGDLSDLTTISDGTLAVGNLNGWNSGSAYVYKRTGSSWALEAYIKAGNNDWSDAYFGYSVSLSGDTLAVGAIGEWHGSTTISTSDVANNDWGAPYSGATYVYRRTGITWAEEAYIKAENSESGDYFGWVVTLSGETLAVTSYYESSDQTTISNGSGVANNDNDNLWGSGAIYVYKRNGSTWMQEAYIKADNANSTVEYGTALSLSGDTLVVGSSAEASDSTTIINGPSTDPEVDYYGKGATYVYKRTGAIWIQEAYIKPINSAYSFGYSVSVSGNTLAVGATGDSSNQNTITNGSGASSNTTKPSSGAVFIYKRVGVNWSQEAYIKAANSDNNDYFGNSVSLNGDSLAVGAYYESSPVQTITNGSSANTVNQNAATGSGAVYVYRNNFKLYDPPEFIPTNIQNTSITFTWNNAGVLATGYKIDFAAGSTPPANCSGGSAVDIGNVLTYNVSGLTANTNYSFRICSSDGVGGLSGGVTMTLRTLP